MPASNSKLIKKSFFVILSIFIFTLLLNILQISYLSWRLKDAISEFRDISSVKGRVEVLDSSRDDVARLSEAIDTPWLVGIFKATGLGQDAEGFSTALLSLSRVLEKSSSLIAEISLVSTQEEISQKVDENLPLIVFSATDIAQLLDSLDSVDWKGLPIVGKRVADLDQRIELADLVWSRNYKSVGVWTELLGSKSPKRYFVALQNSAQARGTGGMPGTFAVIEIDRGKVRILRTGTNAELKSSSRIPIEVPDEFREIYGEYPANWNPSNLSPHFPYAARIWLSLWNLQHDEKLDGAIAVDPFVLASLLKATGNIEVDGKVLTPENTVDELLSRFYVTYENDNQMRKNYLAKVALIFGKKLEESTPAPWDLMQSLLEPLSENRILIYSSSSEIQEIIEQSAMSGSLNFKKSNNYRAIVLNTSGNKMDYYLRRELKIESISCSPRKVKVTFDLLLDVDPQLDLPDYVNGRKDLGMIGGVDNRHGIAVLIFGPPGSVVVPEESDVPKSFLTELGRPVWLKYADLAPKSNEEFVVTFSGGRGGITTSPQPLVKKQITKIMDSCPK